jgi:uncharacterized membrane protein YgcG
MVWTMNFRTPLIASIAVLSALGGVAAAAIALPTSPPKANVAAIVPTATPTPEVRTETVRRTIHVVQRAKATPTATAARTSDDSGHHSGTAATRRTDDSGHHSATAVSRPTASSTDDSGHHNGGDDSGHHSGRDDSGHHGGGNDSGHHGGGDDSGHGRGRGRGGDDD